MNKLFNDLYRFRFVILLLLIYLVVCQYLFGTVCLIKIITGRNCPGCGLTHAFYYLFTFRFKKAYLCNHTVFIWFTYIILFLFDRYIYSFISKFILILMFILCFIVTLINYLVVI